MMEHNSAVTRSMPRIVFLNRYFFPDHSATSQLVSDLAFHWADTGRDVQVVTGSQLYDKPDAVLPRGEEIRGVKIHRVGSSRFGRKSLIGRLIDYLTFYAASYRAAIKLLRPGDILIAKTDPPLLSVLAAHAAKRRHSFLINWLQDLYPEVAARLGIALLQGRVGNYLTNLRNKSLHCATADVVIGEKMAIELARQGVPRNLIHVIPNWTDDEDIFPVAAADNPLRATWNIANKFVIGYSGNLGRAHEIETILGAADRLRLENDLVFLFIGSGYMFEELRRRVRERNLDRLFQFRRYQDRAKLKYSLSAPDVHMLSLQPSLEGLVVPSKFYGIAAAGRPILAIVAADGEFAPLISRHRIGSIVEPGDDAGLAKEILALKADPQRAIDEGRNARKMLDELFSKRSALQRWDALIAGLEPSISRENKTN